jgi:hypothetical protein
MQLVLTEKAKKLMQLCEVEGYKDPFDLLQAVAGESVCPAICMTEGCDYTADLEPDQAQGHCERCGGNTVTSALVIAGFV